MMKEIMMFKFHSSNIYFIASEKCISNDPNLLTGGGGGGHFNPIWSHWQAHRRRRYVRGLEVVLIDADVNQTVPQEST